MTNDAEFTVVFPVVDIRGQAADHVRAWTSHQTLSRERYRLIAVFDDASPSQVQEVASLLGPRDELIHAPGAQSMIGLWQAVASRAATPWLVFTEGHCVADPNCLEVVARWIAGSPTAGAGNFKVSHKDTYLLARISQRWFDMIHEQWRSPGEWPRIVGSGFVIRKDVFESVKGFEPEYDLFAVHFLAAQLHARNIEVAFIADATVVHIDDERMKDHHFDTTGFVRGEMEARSHNDPAFFERYFGHAPHWTNQLRNQPRIVWRMVRAIVAAAIAHPRRMAELAVLLCQFAVEAILNSSARRALQRIAVAIDEVAVGRLPMPDTWRWVWFIRAHRRVVDLTRRVWAHSREMAPIRHGGADQWPIERLGPDTIAGAHGLEHHRGRLFRWTEPVALIRLAPSEGDYELRIETAGLRGNPLAAVIAVVVGGRVLPRNLVTGDDDGTLVVRLPEPWSDAGRDGVILICSALAPARAGMADGRRLGLPILSIANSPLHSTQKRLAAA